VTSHLNDLLVADFSRILAGPLCTMLLGDAGARVIKIEEPRGDETRRWGPPFVGGESAYFLSVNRNKESVVLDLKSAAGLEAAGLLIERADVVVENFKPADRARFGLEPSAVHRRNPRAILCSISGFDADDRDAGLPGYDLLAQAAGGLMTITGSGDGPPVKVGVAISDILTAHYAHGAILAALHARGQSGRGDAIEVSLFGSTVASLANVAQAWLVTGEEPLRYGSAHPSIVPYQAFEASDRAFVLAVATDRHFSLLATSVLDRPGLASDPRYQTNAGRVENRRSLIPDLARLFSTRPAAEWVALCRASGIPAALVERFDEIFSRPILETVEHPSIGPLAQVRSPVRSAFSQVAGTPPPRLGEHTSAVLEELGLGGAAPHRSI
jgi:crotonobetainyl-CoA:carnitine CoA-transferase CaiB-like acyl-CoA transferase